MIATIATSSKSKIYDSDVELVLIHRAKKGDETAFNQLYKIHHNRVLVTIKRMIGNEDTSEWIANLVLAKAWDNLRGFKYKNGKRVRVSGFKEESKFSTWLARVAINEARMHLRAEKRHHDVSLDEAISNGVPANGQPSVDALTFGQRYLTSRDLSLDGIADRQVLDKAISRVPPQFREVLRLRFWEGLSLDEIRAKLSVGEPEIMSVPAVKSRILRGRAVLIEQIGGIS